MNENIPETQGVSDDRERGFQLFKKFFLVFVVLALLGLAFVSGYERGRGSLLSEDDAVVSPENVVILNKNAKSEEIDFALFWKVWDILKDKFFDKSALDAKKMLYGAIDGMLAATGDPYTTFFDPKENTEFQEDISGNFEGIGAEMGIKDDILTIIAPLEDTPAARAGLMAGDRILKIDGEVTTNLEIEEAVRRIRGKQGTEVTLNIFHEGDEEPKDIVVKRDVIHVKSVRFEMKADETVAYIRINRFGEETTSEFEQAVRTAMRSRLQGVVIDVRNNPGGLLESAVDIGSLLLPARSVVVMEENGAGVKHELKTTGGDLLSRVPTAVLINEGSASASEILAGALRENRDNVRLIGKKSFGKGSVQELVSVTKNMAVKITVAKWLTPQGNQINKVGIAPDEEVAVTREDLEAKKDPPLEKALEWLKSQK